MKKEIFKYSVYVVKYSFLTKEEEKKFNNGDSIYLSNERLKEIFNSTSI